MAGVKAKTIFRDLEAADPAIKHRPDKGEIRKLLGMVGVVVAPGDNIQTAMDDAAADGVDLFITGGATSYTPGATLLVPDGLNIKAACHPVIESGFNGPIFSADGLARCSMLGDMELVGTGPAWASGSPVPTPADPYDVSTFQSGVHLKNVQNFLVGDGIECRNLAAGFLNEAPDLNFHGLGQRTFRAAVARDVCFGFRQFNYGEYCRVLDVVATHADYGLWVEAGNVGTLGSTFTDCGVGVRIDGDLQQNEGHGYVTSTQFNHCNYALYFYKVRIGHQISNCFALASPSGSGSSKVELVDSRGVGISGGSYSPELILDATSELLMTGVNIRTDLSPSVTVASGGKFYGRDNHGVSAAGGIAGAGILGSPWNN